jgi:pectate disaccharide-lyase
MSMFNRVATVLLVWAASAFLVFTVACGSSNENPGDGAGASSPGGSPPNGTAGATAGPGGRATGGASNSAGAPTASAGSAGAGPGAAGSAQGGSAPTAGTSSGAGTSAGGSITGVAGGPPVEGAIYVSPMGDDANPGTMDQPFYNLSRAVSGAPAGTTIYMRGGTYNYDATITLGQSGTQAAPIRVLAFSGEKPVLDFSTQPYGADNRAIMLTGNYWHIFGLEIAYAGDNGIKVEGSHNRIELCVFHHNGDSGLQLGFGHDTVNPNGELCSYNEIINCDSYLNFDFDGRGGDSDGFACKMHNGKGNVFRGCRAWRNADDGWDLYETDWPVEIHDCWTWHNGDQTDFNTIYEQKMGKPMSSFSGNGNGFKLGGNGAGGPSKGLHVVTNSVSFDNNFRSKKGFDQNSHHGGVRIVNSVAWGNGYNFMFEEDAEAEGTNEFVNNIAFAPATSPGMEFSPGSVVRNNSWDLAVTADASDFVDLTEGAAMAPRQADGSLPNNGFARLVAGSDLIDKGADVQQPFTGAARDLGAFEQ